MVPLSHRKCPRHCPFFVSLVVLGCPWLSVSKQMFRDCSQCSHVTYHENTMTRSSSIDRRASFPNVLHSASPSVHLIKYPHQGHLKTLNVILRHKRTPETSHIDIFRRLGNRSVGKATLYRPTSIPSVTAGRDSCCVHATYPNKRTFVLLGPSPQHMRYKFATIPARRLHQPPLPRRDVAPCRYQLSAPC